MDGLTAFLNSAGESFVECSLAMLIQSGILIVILLGLDLALRKRVRAVFRYWLWMLVLVKLVLPATLASPASPGYWFGDRLSLGLLTESAIAPGQVSVVRDLGTPVPADRAVSAEPLPKTIVAVPPAIDTESHALAAPLAASDAERTEVVSAVSLTWRALVFLSWLGVVIVAVLLLAQRAFFVRGLIAQSKDASGAMAGIFEQCCRQMGVRKAVALRLSPVAASPSVCGLFRPTILVPHDLAAKLDSRHLRSVLLHELAHIKRGDLWVNFVQAILQIAYIYNPLLWVANAVIRKVREQAVDEMVLAAMGEGAEDYPATLLSISKLTFSRPALSLRLIGVVESKKALAGRIRHIASRPFPKSAKLGILGLIVVVAIGCALLPMARSKKADGSLLPGSWRSAAGAMSYPGSAFVAVCEAVEEAGCERVKTGMYRASQEFRVVELLTLSEFRMGLLHIEYIYCAKPSDKPDQQERAIRKGEQVIWVVGKDPEGLRGIKALADTAANRELFEVEPSIARFQTAPSQDDADILASLIDIQAVTSEQAKRILELLFRPKVTKRKAYPLGETPYISVERPFRVRFRKMRIRNEEHVWAKGEHQHGHSSGGGSSWSPTPQLINLHPVPNEPGAYEFEIRYKYACSPGRDLDLRLPVVYECEFAVPVEVLMVEKEKAEKVTFTSSPELDQSMPSVFSVETQKLAGTYNTPSGKRQYTGGIQINYKDIPHAAAFRCVFQFPDGREVVQELGHIDDEPIRLRANSSGTFFTTPRNLLFEQPGEYSGTLILRPDIEVAYRDPAIKSIWNGELKFPISFTVEVAEAADKADVDVQKKGSDVLRVVDGDSGEILFDIGDIVRFDWSKQIFELTRSAAMDFMARMVGLDRGFEVRLGKDTVYSGSLVSVYSSKSYPHPVIMFPLSRTGVKEPLFAIEGGYPGDSDNSELRFSERLKEALQQADVLGEIDVNNPPAPIEKVTHGWSGEKDGLRALVETFPETFRLYRSVRVHIHLTGAKYLNEDHVIDVNATLVSGRGKSKFSTKKIFPYHAAGWKSICVLEMDPWGPARESTSGKVKPGNAELSIEVVTRKILDESTKKYSNPIDHVETGPIGVHIRGGRRLLPEKPNAVITQFQKALRESDWAKALTYCTEKIKTRAAKYESIEAFFKDVLPIEEIISLPEFERSGGGPADEKVISYQCEVRFKRPVSKYRLRWNVLLHRENSNWLVEFPTRPLDIWIKHKDLRMKLANGELKVDGEKIRKGFKVSLIALSEDFVIGKPMLFRLEMKNVSNETLGPVQTTSVMVNDPMIVKDPNGDKIPYIDTPYSIWLGDGFLEPGEVIVLADNYDVRSQYHITTPGKYTFQFRGFFTPNPSNSVEIDVKPGRLAAIESIVESLMPVLPEGWKLTRRNIPSDRIAEGETGKAILVHLIGKAGRSKGDDIGLLLFVNPSKSDQGSEFLGQSRWGPVCVQSLDAEQLWPNYKEQIINALNIQIPQPNPAVGADGNKDREMRSNADAHIRLIWAQEDEDEKNYRWGVTRSSPLKVIQGWFEFDQKDVRAHGGGGRKIAETRPMQLTLRISKENGFLVLHRGYGWSSTEGDQKADIANKIEWPAGAVLRTYHLSEPAGLTDELQPVWKGELIQNGKVAKSVVHAVRVVKENVSDELFDAGDTSEALRIGRTWAPKPDPAKKEYEGRTIAEWIDRCHSESYEDRGEAGEALIRIGRPAVPVIVEAMKKGRAHHLYEVLAKMGPAAEEAVPWLMEVALDRSMSAPDGWGSASSYRTTVVICLRRMTWASERLFPVFKKIAEDTGDDRTVRAMAVDGLKNKPEQAIPVLEKLVRSKGDEGRQYWQRALAELLEQTGRQSKEQYYMRLIEQDPFDPNVLSHLTSVKRMTNWGRLHPPTQRVKKLWRQRLAKEPDPELAWGLATIIHNGLANTELQWAAPADSSRGRQNREDPAENFDTLAKVLELGLEHSKPDSDLRQKFGIGLAKLRLLQGDWDGMNAALKQLGQKPMPKKGRSWLCAPPVDWREDLSSRWAAADEQMRSGNCSLEFRIDKDGKGLKGVHFLVKRAPEPANITSTGIAVDTLLFMPRPLGGERFSFGYMAKDRAMTRYAVSDESGVVRFDKLPKMPVKVEVLVPTSNFPESGSRWELWMEVEPGKFKIAKIYGGADAVGGGWPPAPEELRQGETVHYPRLAVRPAFGFDVGDWDRVDKEDLVLSWEGLDSSLIEKGLRYELEMHLSAPAQQTRSTRNAPVIKSAKQITKDSQWLVGAEGVGDLRFHPGNIYMFEVRAVDKAGTVIARWPKTRVWVPWGYRQSDPPFTFSHLRRHDRYDNPPIYDDTWWRGEYHYEDHPAENLKEKVTRFIRDYPNAFEHEHARLGKAWLDWHEGDNDGARQQLQRLTKELPKGNVVRGTAVWLLQQMDENKRPLKRHRRLNFVPDQGASGP